MIAMLLPGVAFGNKVPILVPHVEADATSQQYLPLLLANMNSFAFDFSLRQKLQGQTINLFILEQLPVIARERFEQPLGSLATQYAPSPQPTLRGRGRKAETIAEFIRAEALALTYTAHDMAPFARDMGCVSADGSVKPPFVWDVDDRTHRMARLDAIFMKLYGLSEDDADYVLSTFPIVRDKDVAAFGTFRTRDLIVSYMGDLETGVLSHADRSA